MKNNQNLLRITFMGMMIALGVVISPILRVEGMCPMAHLINVTCAVFIGPYYAFLCALIIGGLIVWKHRGNLQRILKGTESKFSLHKKEAGK